MLHSCALIESHKIRIIRINGNFKPIRYTDADSIILHFAISNKLHKIFIFRENHFSNFIIFEKK